MKLYRFPTGPHRVGKLFKGIGAIRTIRRADPKPEASGDFPGV